MFVFPDIRADGKRWSLPLANHTALALYQQMLDPDTEALRQFAMVDPPLLMWLSQFFGGDDVVSIGDLAAVAAPALAQSWSRGGADLPENIPRHVRWPELVGRSLSVAALAAWFARRRQERGEDIVIERAYWIAMLTDATDWLRTVGPAVKQADLGEVMSGFGPELSAEIAAARHGRKRSPECSCVTEARRAFRKEGMSALESAGVGGSAARDIADTVALWRAELRERDDVAQSPAAATWGAGSPVPGQALWRLAVQLNRLQQLTDRFERELQAAKLAAMAELAYGAGHEINNPLANIASRAQTLLRDETQPDRRRQLATIEAQAYRAYEMISDMMYFAKPPESQFEDVCVLAIVEALQTTVTADAARQGTELNWEIQHPDRQCRVDVAQVQTAVRALLQNSLDALEGGGEITVTVSRGDDALLIAIRDTGPGLTPRARDHLFDPFFSGREAGRGLGLGLSKVWAIVQAHGGDVVVSEPAGGGLSVELRFPQGVSAAAVRAESGSG